MKKNQNLINKGNLLHAENLSLFRDRKISQYNRYKIG